MGAEDLDLAGVHHDPDPLSHGLGGGVSWTLGAGGGGAAPRRSAPGRVCTCGGRLRANLARTEPALPWGRVTLEGGYERELGKPIRKTN